MAAPAWFVQHLEELRRLPGSRPASARTLAEWAAQVGDAEAPSRPTISRWLGGVTLPTGFRPLELMVLGVREHTRDPSRQAKETLLRVPWWREVYERARTDSGRGEGDAGEGPPVVYQGLDPFGRDDADRFFGRELAVEAIVDRLDVAHRSPAGGPLMVLGPSGVGKSSVLAAGVLPLLEKHGLPSDPGIAMRPTEILTPGPDPLTALADALGAVGGTTRRDMVLVVDQFEEVFGVPDDVRRKFVEELVDLATPRPGAADDARAVVVVACRNDFYPELRRLGPLKAVLGSPFNLDPLTPDELGEAIRQPARQAGITVGNDLVARLVADAGVSDGGTIEGQLPLISHVLQVMNQAGPMTVRAYERVGGIDGAVAHSASQAWDALQRAGLEDTALALLVRLVRVGDHPGGDTRRPLDRRELISPGADRRIEQALEILSRARLVTVGRDSVQITHEALLRAWRRLRDAIDSERTDHVLRQNVELRARQWDEAGRPDEQLLRGTVLVAAHRVTTTSATVDDLSREFLDAADAQEQQLAVRRNRLRLAAVVAVALIVMVGAVAIVEGVAEHRVNRRVVLAEVIAQAKGLEETDASLAAQLYLTAYRMAPDPELYTTLTATENEPLSRSLLGHQGIVRAVGQSGSTLVSAGDDGTIRLWLDGAGPAGGGPGGAGGAPGAAPAPVILTEPGPVGGLAVDPGRQIMVSSEERAIPGQSALRVWDIRDPGHPVPVTAELPSGAEHLAGLAIGAGGRLLAAVAGDGTVRLWDVADPAHPVDLGARLPGATGNVYGSGVAISPDGATLAAAGTGGSIRLWDIRDPARPVGSPPLPGGSTLARAVAFSPTRNVLVTGGGDSALRLWDTADPVHPRLLAQPLATPGASILAAAVSPDGTTVAAASGDNTVTLWNIADPARPIPLGRPLTGHGRGVGAVLFGPDGHTLVTGSADSTVRVWSLPATRLTGLPGNVTSVALSPDGHTLAAGGGSDDAVHLWDTTDSASPTPIGPLPAGGFVNSIAFTRDSGVLIGGGGHAVRAWSMRDPRHPVPIGPDLVLPVDVGGVGVSPDGRVLAVGGGDGVTRLFALADPARPPTPIAALPGTPNQLVGTAHFSPDGRILATAGADDEIRLWDTTDPARARPLAPPLEGHTDEVYQLAFDPGGTHLASVSADHTTRIWDLRDPTHPTQTGPPLLEQADAVGGLSWSPDGRTLATGSDDKTVALWDATDPGRATAIGEPLLGHTDRIYAVAFGPDSRVLASGGRDRTVLLWHLDVDSAIDRICRATPGTLTPQAWNTYVSQDEPYDPPCGADAGGTQAASASR